MKAGSFRTRLALRFTALMAAVFLLVGLMASALLRRMLTAQLDGTLLRLAAIEASALTDASGPQEVHFHEGTFDPPRSARSTELVRYAEIWRLDGSAVLRSASLGDRDLPLESNAVSAVLRSDPAVETVPWPGGALRSVYYPLARLGRGFDGQFLQVAAPLEPVNSVLRMLLQFLAGLGLMATGLTFVGGWALASRAIRPAREIAEQTEAVTAGSLGARIQAKADAVEYQRLVAVLNAMLERLEVAFDAQRRFVADASHEIRHPLAVLRAALELALRRDRTPNEYRAALSDGVQQAERISALAEGLLLLARSDAGVLQPRRAPHDLIALAAAACERARLVAERRGIHVALEVGGADGALDGATREQTTALIDAGLVAQALDNLLDNAVKFTPEGGSVRVVLQRATTDWCIHVIDTGPGVPPGDRARLFERFFRGDPARSVETGTGLGLAIASGILAAHGGTVSFAPMEPTGSCFTLRLPRREAKEHRGPVRLEVSRRGVL